MVTKAQEDAKKHENMRTRKQNLHTRCCSHLNSPNRVRFGVAALSFRLKQSGCLHVQQCSNINWVKISF